MARAEVLSSTLLCVLLITLASVIKDASSDTVVVAATDGVAPTHNTLSFTAKIDGTKEFRVSAVTKTPDEGTWDPYAPTASENGATFVYAATSGLTPATQYTATFTVAAAVGTTSGNEVTPSNVGDVEGVLCTKAEPVTNAGVTSTATSLTLTWDDPDHADSHVKVRFGSDDYTVARGDQTYILQGLAPGTDGDCKIVTAGTGDCTDENIVPVASCATKEVLVFTDGPVTATSVSFDVSIGSPKTFSFGEVTYAPSTPATTNPTDTSTAAALFTVSATSLQPFTKYQFDFASVSAGAGLVGALDASASHSICTSGEGATNLVVDESGTNSNAIKITWTKPATDAPALKVAFDNQEVDITDVTTEEHVFSGLQPNQKGVCKVIALGSGTANADCTPEEVSIECKTSWADAVHPEIVMTAFFVFINIVRF